MLTFLQRLILFALLVLSVASPSTQLSAQTLQIDSLKANYLNGFIDFLRWDGKLNTNAATIGVIGSSELVSHLKKIAAKKRGGRDLKILTIDADSNLEGVDILYIAQGQNRNWRSMGDSCRKNRILSVGEEEGFVKEGGCIEFTIRKNRLRFIISPQNAKDNGIEVSSKLIELALDQK